MLDYLGRPTSSPTPRCRRRRRATLDGFLFDAKQGYCQQYSGAMALLLRMAGIPARVVTGFSTGATDTKTGEYVVRDFDAHSWVEVYYPDWGWITFDPTPADSPARSQPADAREHPERRHRRRRRRTSAATRSSERGARRRRPPPSRRRGGGSRLIVAGRARRSSASAALGVRRWRRGAPPRAVGARARAAAHAPRARARARRCTRSSCASPTRPRRRATCARCARAATATSRRHPTRAQRRGLRSELGRGGGLLGPPARLVGPPAPVTRPRAYNWTDGRCL